MTSVPLKVAANRERRRFEDVVARRDLKEVERGSGAPVTGHPPPPPRKVDVTATSHDARIKNRHHDHPSVSFSKPTTTTLYNSANTHTRCSEQPSQSHISLAASLLDANYILLQSLGRRRPRRLQKSRTRFVLRFKSADSFANDVVHRSISLSGRASPAPSTLARRWWIQPSRPSVPPSARRPALLRMPKKWLGRRRTKLPSQRSKRQKMQDRS